MNKTRWGGVAEWLRLLRLIHRGPNIDCAQCCRVCPEDTRINWAEQTKFDSHHILLCRCYYWPVLQITKITWDNKWAKKYKQLKFMSKEISALITKGIKFKITIGYYFSINQICKDWKNPEKPYDCQWWWLPSNTGRGFDSHLLLRKRLIDTTFK